jgi:hypothetical protein
MAEVFEVQHVTVNAGTTAAVGWPLLHVPTSGGCITLIDAEILMGTARVAGTVTLRYGTAASGGTCVVLGTIGTAYGTGGGTFPAMCLNPITLTNPVVAGGYWIDILGANAMTTAGLTTVYLAYVQGKK